MDYKEKIDFNPKIMLGKPTIKGTRITVELILRKLSEGGSEHEILEAYPSISHEDVLAALSYSADVIAKEEIFHIMTVELEDKKKGVLADPVVRIIIDRLTARLGKDLQELWLFGSRARGDNSEDSDYDILVIANGKLHEIRQAVFEEEYQMLCSYYQLVGGPVHNKESWLLESNSPLAWNVRKEGEPPRLYRRHKTVRGLWYGKAQQVFEGSSGTGGSVGIRA